MRICLAILVTLVACKNRDVERMTEVKRDVCACKDPRCADQAMNEVPRASIRSTPRIQAIAREIMECRAQLEAADRPSTDPDAEGGAGSNEGGNQGGNGGSAAPTGSAGSAPANATPAPVPAKAAR